MNPVFRNVTIYGQASWLIHYNHHFVVTIFTTDAVAVVVAVVGHNSVGEQSQLSPDKVVNSRE